MLKKENFTKENIERLHAISGNAPSLLEKTVYAFGLLEAISKVGMPFVFKGGTCLMLLLEKPKRLSTDIDIVVEPGTDVKKYIEEAGKLFPFISQKEDVRKGANNIEKRHYEFVYDSPINGKPLVILLDILFEKNLYSNLIEKSIENEMLLTEDENLTVRIPDVNNILGDKLTAFAPYTTGIPFGVGKELEIIKQMFDCCSLAKEMTSFPTVKEVYKKVAETELEYRGFKFDVSEVLKDTIKSCFCIISKGGIAKDEYEYFFDGIRRIGGHIYNEKFNGEYAAYMACELLYLVSCMYIESEYKPIGDYNEYINEKLYFKDSKKVGYLKKVQPECYAYVVASVKLLGDKIEEILEF